MAKATKIAAKSDTKAQGATKAAKATKAASKAKAPQNERQTPQKASQTNPYRVGGGYHASVEALRTLGVGKFHAFDKIVPAVRKAMTEAGTFKAFAAKEGRNENAKDTEGRILQNVSVVARKDYGKALRDIGWEVVWDGREKKAGLFRLNGKAK